MIRLKQGVQFSKFSAALSAYVASAVSIERLSPNLTVTRKRLARLVSFYSHLALRILNIELTVKGKIPPGNFLVVANHMSYIDVLFIASVLKTNFVTSVEIRETPFLGYLTRLGGCLYVERRNKSNLHNEIKDVTDALNAGMSVGVFPEATSTDGSQIIRFRRPLFYAALETGMRILPVTINYNKIDGKKVDAKSRDLLCWYGDMSFLPHILKMMTLKKIEVSMEIHEPIVIKTEDEYNAVAGRTQELIAKTFHPLGAPVQPQHSTVQ